MKKIDIKFIASSAIIAALYVALTWLLAPISYGSIQFRLSEILVLLVFFNPKYALAIIIGTFISNTTSSLGWYDMVFGTLATTLSVLTITKCKNIYQAALAPVIFNGLIVALELLIALEIPFVMSLIYVAFGEAVVLFFIGIPVMNSIKNNEVLLESLELENKEIKGMAKVSVFNSILLVISSVTIILFFACPMFQDILSSVYPSNTTLLDIAQKNSYLWLFVIIPVIYLLVTLFTKKYIKTILLTVLSFTLLSLSIFIAKAEDRYNVLEYYYMYLAIVCVMVILPIVSLFVKKENKNA